MARIVCQVLNRPDRVTFIWSLGKSSFGPYHLGGEPAAEFRRLAAHGRERLADAASQGPAGLSGLVEAGHRLYLAIFPAAQEDAAPIQNWLAERESQGAIAGLEIVSDVPGSVPWNMVCSSASEPKFWGSHNLVAGRRVNGWRQVPWLEKPAILLVVDPRLRDALPDEEKDRLAELARTQGLGIVDSTIAWKTRLESAVDAEAPAFLYLFCRATARGFHLGDDLVSPTELAQLLEGEEPDPVGPLVFVNACRLSGSEPAEPIMEMVQSLSLGGLIAAEQLAPAREANQIGLDFLSRFLWAGEPLGQALQKARALGGPAGLLYNAFCPGHVRTIWDDVPPGTPAGEEPVLEAPEPLPLPEAPYRPLAPFDREQQALFTGREEDVADFADLVDRADTRLVIVHGPSGVGKSSFLRAGALPYLEDWSIGFRALRDRTEEESPVAFALPSSPPPSESDYPVVSIRASHDLAGQMAEAIVAFCDQPLRFTTPTGAPATVDLPGILRSHVAGAGPFQEAIQTTAGPGGPVPPPLPAGSGRPPEKVTPPELWEAMQNDPGLLARLVTAVTEPLPHELLILIEQGEELFTHAVKPVDRERRRLALHMLARLARAGGSYKVIFALRTEFLGRFLNEFPYHDKVPSFLLAELSDQDIIRAILLPTTDEPVPFSSEIPQQKYHFYFEEGVPRAILRDVRLASERRESLLAAVQGVCAQLAELVQDQEDRVIREKDLKLLTKKGKVRPGLPGYVDRVLERTFSNPADRSAFKGLAEELQQQSPEGTICRRLVSIGELERTWKGRAPVQELLDQASAADAGLLEFNQLLIGGKEGPFASLGSDGLAQVAAGLGTDEKRRSSVRSRTFDMLWIFIPLLFLVSAGTFYVTRQSGGAQDEEMIPKKQVVRILKEQQEQLEALKYSLYVGQMALADQAQESGNVLRARQWLRNHQPESDPGEPADQRKPDLRGFEWHYLWKKCHPERHTLLGHLSQVSSVALSANGKLAVSASLDGTVKLWDTASGQIQVTYLGQAGPVLAAAVAGDGNTVASAGADGRVHLWDSSGLFGGDLKEYTVREKATKVLAGHQGLVRSLAFAPKGASKAPLLASGSDDKTVILWDLVKGDKKAVLKGHEGEVRAVDFSPDGKTLASAGMDSLVLLWDSATGKQQQALKGHAGPVLAVAFSPDGKWLASGGIETRDNVEVGAIRLWDPSTGKPAGAANSILHSQGTFALAFTSDSKTLISAGKDNHIRLWDPLSGEPKATISGHLGWIGALAIALDGRTVVTGSYDQTVRVWDGNFGANPEILSGHKDWVCSVAFSPDDKVLASASRDGTVKLWDPVTGRVLETLDLGAPVLAVAFSPVAPPNLKGSLKLAAGTWKEGSKGEARLWEVTRDKGGAKTKELHRLQGHAGGIACLAFSPDGTVLASAGEDKIICLWDVGSGKPGASRLKGQLKGHPAPIRCLAFAPEGELLASGGDDALSVFFWDWRNGKLAGKPMTTLTDSITALAYFPALSSLLASGGNDQAVKLWKTDERQYKGTFRGHSNGILALAASPRGDFLASTGWDGTIKLWSRPGGDERFTFTGHKGPVRGLAISSDALTLASAGHDGSVRLWRAAPERATHDQKMGNR